MAIPGTPQNMYVQTANQQILISWDLSAGATSYIVQRSQDNVTFTTLATVSGSPLATSYIDTTASLGTPYWYQVAASNTSGTSNYTTAQSATPVKQGEMTLGQIRLASQQKADRVNSQFVTVPEWNQYINRAMYELYDILVQVYEDYFIGVPVQFNTDGATYVYDLPDGKTTYTNGLNNNQTLVAPPWYKITGVDLALNPGADAYLTINKFNFIDRNRFFYPNTAPTMYGVFNMRYRLVGNQIMFIPTPAGSQAIRIWYIPRLELLLNDSDTTVSGINGYIEYVITRAAKYALDKEESDTGFLAQEIAFLKERIEKAAENRDAGQPDRISDTRQSDWQDGFWNGNGQWGGW